MYSNHGDSPNILKMEHADKENENSIAIRVSNLFKCYHVYDNPRDRLMQIVAPRLQRLTWQSPRQYFREFWALKEVSFEIKKAETVGIIGRNGSGKSTLLQMICGTLNPTSGSIQTNGSIAALLELDSEFTGRKKIKRCLFPFLSNINVKMQAQSNNRYIFELKI
ncbi:MAG: ATP-binding cassette domain-containing protein [Methylococcales bacterium]|nr:ATP-binding cassette domain-containing protein [Methylococcales bacterium]MDD5630716.1 ATP-binding cassette domain-containing protein [Methylococcales bacterium]